MRIGYARVSSEDQKLDLQHDALRAAGCEKIFEEKISGTSARLPAREELLDYARHGDVVVVWKLDRLGRSLHDPVDAVVWLRASGVGFCSLQESIDTTSASGKLTFHVFAALAEFEADIVRARTHAGLTAARARGAQLGRPRVLRPEQLEMAQLGTWCSADLGWGVVDLASNRGWGQGRIESSSLSNRSGRRRGSV